MALELNGREHYGQLNFVDNTIESLTGDIDIQIGLTGSAADIKLNRNVTLAKGKSLALVDHALDETTTMSVISGSLIISGANQLEIGNIQIYDNTIESSEPTIDIQLGAISATADLVVNRNTVLYPGKTLTVRGDSYQTGSMHLTGSLEVVGSITNTTTNSTVDTDRFLVEDSGIIKYRTGAQMLTDLGVAPGVASNIQHQVKAGVAINKGQAVYVTGANGVNIIVGLASNTSEPPSSKTLGLLDSTVSANGFANVIAEGLLGGLDTSGATAGDPVWLGTNGNLIYGLANKPYAPAHLVFLGVVTRVNNNNGEIFVKVQNGFELKELHDVQDFSTTGSYGDLLVKSGDVWVNSKQLTGSYTITGSLTSTQGFTGSLQGNATTSTSASYALNSTNAINADTVDGRHASEFVLNTATGSLATQTYVNTAVANLVDAAPGTLDTLNELAAALGDDPNFATTIATSVGTKQPQLSGTGFVKASGTTISYDNSTYYLASNPSGFITSGGSITGNAATATSATSATQLNGYSNQTEATILTGPANGPVWKVRYDSATANRYVDLGFKDGNGTYSEGLKIYNGDNFTWKGSTVLHAGNYSSYAVPTTRTITINGTSLDLSADRSFTVTASDTTKLPLAGGTLTGTLGLVGYGTNGFTNGTGDGSSFTTYNFALSGWSSMAFYNPTSGGTFPNQVSGLIDFREGRINMKGDLRASIFYDSNNTGYYLNPNGTSNVVTVNADNYYQNSGGYTQLGFTNTNAVQWPLFRFGPADIGNGWDEGIIKASTTEGVFGRYGMGIHMNEARAFGIYSSGWNKIMGFKSDAVQSYQPVTAPSLQLSGALRQGGILARPSVQWGASGNVTGAVVIKLPGTSPGNYGMIHAVIDIYEYNSNNVCTIIIGGHNWSTQWYNFGAEVIGNTNKQVRLAVKDGKYCIVLGDGSSIWEYGQVVLRKIQNGTYYDGVMDLGGAYSIGIESDAYTWVSGNLNTFSSTNVIATSAAYAPIYYDNNDTSYYGDFNSTSDSAVRQRGGTLHGPNPTWGAYLLVGGDGRQNYTNNTTVASVCTTNGNLHLDAASGYQTYINFYDGDVVNFGNGASNTVSTINTDGSHRPQTIYDYNDTGYYLDPTSSGLALKLNGNIEVFARSASWAEGIRVRVPSTSTWGGFRVTRDRGNSDGNWYFGYVGFDSSDDFVFGSNNNGTQVDNVLRLSKAGHVFAQGDITAYYSDERLKEKKGNVKDALNKILSLNGFYYVNNQIAKENGFTEQTLQLGLSAQEVQAIAPEIVTLAPFDTEFNKDGSKTSKSGENYLTVSYNKVVPILVEAIKEQQTQIENQQSQIDQLKSLVKQLLG